MKIERVKILNIEINSINRSTILTSGLRGLIVTPNVDHLIKLQSDSEFYSVYKNADWIFCDSRLIYIFSKFLGNPIKELITGSDLFPDYCKQIASKKENNKKIFILGGTTSNILESSVNELNSYSTVDYIVDSYSPEFGFEDNPLIIDLIIKKIRNSNANVLAVGLGAPKQELLINKIREEIPRVKLFFAIGATIDFISGDLKRAPLWVQKLSLEWLYRMLKDPKRLVKRYLYDDLPIFHLIFMQRIGRYKNPFKPIIKLVNDKKNIN